MYKTGGQLLGVNGSIYKFNTSLTSIIKPLDPQPPNGVSDMCIDTSTNRLFVIPPGTGGQVWVYSTITLSRTNVISGFSAPRFIRKDPNPANNRVTVYDFNNNGFMFIDLTTLEVSNTTFSSTVIDGGFDYDQNIGRNQILVSPRPNTVSILNATTFAVVQQIIDPQIINSGKVRRNAHNADEIIVFNGGYLNVVVMNMANLSYTFKTFSNGAFDADADPNLPNNIIYSAISAGSAKYTASDFGFIESLNFPSAFVVVADPTIANHQLFFGGGPILYAAILG
ncbi:hypothetical protein G7092_09885 [Mucilaginibacter sp. HC2]|uniref:hypothetical protein n=1 Tax=Mucilaginibacter inviolabilis TaxID=2714892 RepID=UPI0014078676|nr:hypothetical protein [Mucilaginibacter inviolabilis]NHA04108.1 hypothetical protein [Mucilaginibacter inviolabilis]